MIILQRKRIFLITCIVMVSIFSYLLGSSNMYETLETVSLPISNKTIILDAGHGRRRWSEQYHQMV